MLLCFSFKCRFNRGCWLILVYSLSHYGRNWTHMASAQLLDRETLSFLAGSEGKTQNPRKAQTWLVTGTNPHGSFKDHFLVLPKGRGKGDRAFIKHSLKDEPFTREETEVQQGDGTCLGLPSQAGGRAGSCVSGPRHSQHAIRPTRGQS